MASPTDASHASLASGNQWEEEEKAFRERVDQEIKQVRAQPPPLQQQANQPLEASHSTVAQTPVGKSPADEYTDSGRRRSVRFADQPDIQEGAEGSLGREDGAPEGMSADGDGDDSDDDSDDDVDADYDAADDAFEEDEDREDGADDEEGALSTAAATSELLANINISQLPSNILMQLTPQDVAEEFAERVSALELELSETKERAESTVREWKAKYRELDIQDILKHTEMATLRGENQELKEKVSSYKKNLWMKSVDLETIKLVEDEVLDVMTARDKELNNFRDIKQQEVEVIKALHTKDMDEQTEILNKQLTDAMASIMQKECLTTNQKEGEELVHQSVNDPLDILKTLSSINVELHNKTFGSENTRAKLSAIIQQYRERELELLNQHIGPTPSQETAQRHAAEEEIIEKGRLDRCELNEYISELQDLMAASASGLPLLRELSKEAAEAADEARDATLKSVAASEDGEDGFPTGIAADRLKELEARDAQLAQLVEAMTEAHRMMAEVATKAAEYDTLTNADEDRRLNAPSIEKLNRDPLFAGILYDSAFAQRLEDVLRENERLKARLHIAGDTKFAENAGAAHAELTQKADQLEARCNHLNAQCIALEEQKKELKTLKDQLQEEAEEYVRASPESALKKGVLQEITERSDSEDTNSLPDSDTDSEDIYDEHQMMEMDQIAGVEVHVEEPEDEDPTTLALEKTQFHSTMRKEKHVASLVEQILQYLEVGCAVFRIRGLRLEKKYAYLAANRSVIRLCDYTEGKPNRKQGLDQVHLRHIKAIVLGQDTWDKKITKNVANKRIDPEDLHQCPKNSEKVEIHSTGTYFYRSLTLKRRTGESFNFIANTDNDFEAWVVALHRITTHEPEFEKPIDVVKHCYPGSEVLVPEEKQFCDETHCPPLLYLNAKMQCLKQEYKIYLTLYDVRTLSGFNLLQSQKLFELWLRLCWIEKQYVYQLQYLLDNPQEASNLLATIDMEHQKEQKRLLNHGVNSPKHVLSEAPTLETGADPNEVSQIHNQSQLAQSQLAQSQLSAGPSAGTR